ncbi:nitrite reductase large subunit NirB [Carnobacterium gallinarum]|uniref:nitrite reductase large subunit NirB n=1 Tax=Carnobacterium gallinarum TaxID=2749 RepID=UPI00054E9B3D|nr:nitrite reductase large subunit NirB [Carnobacterium gallinarum]
MKNKERLVMIGNGMAGIRTLEEILERDADLYDITVIGEENYPNYNRIMLSNILQKKMTTDEIIMNEYSWYQENGVTLINGNPIEKIDTIIKCVYTKDGQEIGYDKLILATGSRAFMLPVEGIHLEGVLGFRTIDDTEMMLDISKNYHKAVVIGGGLLGLEAAKGLHDQGMDVTVVHLAEWLMETQLDRRAGQLLQTDLEAQGLKFAIGKATSRIIGEKRVTGLEFTDGTQLDTDLVVMSIGIRPEISLANGTPLEVNRGFVVNDYLETTITDIYAVGECCEHRGIAYGLVAPLYEQGKVLADRLTYRETAPYEGSKMFTQLKVSGCDLFSAGSIVENDEIKGVESFDGTTNSYKKIFIKDGKLAGVVLYGDTVEGNRYYNILKKEEALTDYKMVSLLYTGEDDLGGDISAMSDDETVCGCNGVSKGTIVQAIQEKGLTTVAEVTAQTKAGNSCGKCKGVVGDILAYTLGDDFQAAGPTGICGCTTLTRDQIVIGIRQKELKSIKEVRHVLNFDNLDGCPNCHPALNYYLNMIYPHEHEDEKASRYVNERMHGNIQKDGTYSVIPRMRGGKTNPQQLMKIAQVAEKYDVPLVKITGSQRIGLYGVKKEDMPKIWEELDMTSASAYAKAFRSVKTCVGKNHCRFGTQDSMGLGIKLETKFEFIDTPHKFKMGISACPRSCVESGVKDFGVIGVENGFQIYIGGNGGTEIKEGRLLTTAETEEEVIELCGAMLQYYRETGIYAERTAPWLDRMGFEKVQEILLNKEVRSELNMELEKAMDGKQVNPWEQILQDKKKKAELYTVERA